MARPDPVTARAIADTASGRLAKAVGIAVAFLVAVILIMGLNLRGQSARLGKVEDTQAAVLGIVKSVQTLAMQGQDVLELVRKQQEEEARAGKIRQDQLERLTAISREQEAIAKQTQAIARQIPECLTPPNGICAKAMASSLAKISADQEALLARTTFVAVNPAKPGETSYIVKPEIHPQECVGVGNVGVLPGVLTCSQPSP